MPIKTRRQLFALAASSLLICAAPAVRAADPIQLEFGNWLPSTSAQSKNSFEPWKALVEERTGGRVKVNLYHGGVLGSSRAVLNDVKGGVYHVGLLVDAYYYETPLFKFLIGELPFALPEPVVATKVMNEFVDKYGNEVFDQLKVKNMGVFVSDAYVMFSTKPIRGLADLKGKKLRAPGKAWVQIAKDWGAVPVPMQPEEMYTALERGTLDVAQYSPTGAMGWKYYEPAPYVTKVEAPIIIGGLIMNQTFYNKLPDDLKKMFDNELNPALMKMVVAGYAQGAADALEKMSQVFKASGRGEVITLSPEEKAKFVGRTEPEWAAWVQEANKRGYPGEAMMADFKAILKKNGLTSPF
ncbi:TRAP transporter substrate-binding protein [Piscinibacter sakaiensis]|uniref:TRAP transporter substrate-binding protein n=1 Tax=Piscinibacter sakaiensis TaxID=1547922 RepID=UPI003AAD5F94